jgi:hypothetical protein
MSTHTQHASTYTFEARDHTNFRTHTPSGLRTSTGHAGHRQDDNYRCASRCPRGTWFQSSAHVIHQQCSGQYARQNQGMLTVPVSLCRCVGVGHAPRRLPWYLRSCARSHTRTHTHTHMRTQESGQVDDNCVRLLSRGHRTPESISDFVLRPEAFETADAIRERMRRVKVVATTCQNTHHALLRRKVFDVCIVDEASQVQVYSQHPHPDASCPMHTVIPSCFTYEYAQTYTGPVRFPSCPASVCMRIAPYTTRRM